MIDSDFLKPFPDADELAAGRKPAAFLIVKSMLLTGFDAPVEQVLYLDRSMKEAELLQAVARVNRPADGKKCGYVIDYVGRHQPPHRGAEGLLRRRHPGRAEGPARPRSAISARSGDRIRLLFTDQRRQPGRRASEAIEDCVALLEDGQLRDRFEVELKKFLSTVDTVLPLPDARPYLRRREAVRRDRDCAPAAGTGSTTARSTRACTGRRSAS